VLGYTGPDVPNNDGDRTLTRIDPSTGEVKTVGGLAPCGLTADPSGDVWVANCFVSGSGPVTNVLRVDARTLKFEPTWRVPAGDGYFVVLPTAVARSGSQTPAAPHSTATESRKWIHGPAPNGRSSWIATRAGWPGRRRTATSG
jgi:streptogramin lyase